TECKSQLARSELRRALDYIYDNMGSDLSLRELAAIAGVSASYFATLFKQATGMSPHQYVIHRRVEKARSLLHQSELSIGQIAVLTGFYDSSHLNHHFKRLTGVTPKTLRGSP